MDNNKFPREDIESPFTVEEIEMILKGEYQKSMYKVEKPLIFDEILDDK